MHYAQHYLVFNAKYENKLYEKKVCTLLIECHLQYLKSYSTPGNQKTNKNIQNVKNILRGLPF